LMPLETLLVSLNTSRKFFRFSRVQSPEMPDPLSFPPAISRQLPSLPTSSCTHDVISFSSSLASFDAHKIPLPFLKPDRTFPLPPTSPIIILREKKDLHRFSFPHPFFFFFDQTLVRKETANSVLVLGLSNGTAIAETPIL